MIKYGVGWSYIRANLSGKSFLSSIVILLGGTVFGQGLILLSSPILTRLYIPEDLGQFSLITSFLGVATVFATLSYDSAIVAARSDREAARVTLLAMVLSSIVSILAVLVLYFMVEYKILGFDNLPLSMLPIIWLGLILTATFSSLRYWLIRTNDFQLISRINIIQNVVRAVSQLGLGFGHIGWFGLVLGDLLGRGSGVVSMIQQTKSLFRQELQSLSFREILDVLKLYKRFPGLALPSSFIDALALALPLPLIVQYYGSTAAGQFALVQRVIAIPMTIIGASVADVFYNKVGIYSRENPQLIEPFFLRVAIGLGGMGLVPVGIMIIYGPYLFSLIFGLNWEAAGSLAAVMSVWALAQFIVSPLSRVVYVVGNQQLKLVYDISSLMIVLGSFYCGHLLQLSVIGTVALLSILMTGAYGVYFVLLIFAIRRAKLNS